MGRQNYKNHGRLVPGYHYIGGGLCSLLLIGSIVNLIMATKEHIFTNSLLVLASIIIFIMAFYARSFALKAQDRAIRAEENFRHYLLTGKPLSSSLRMHQIVALRFASDEEFLILAERAIKEKLTAKEIKQGIQHWKPNTYRV